MVASSNEVSSLPFLAVWLKKELIMKTEHASEFNRACKKRTALL
jgi:hypothetical protein